MISFGFDIGTTTLRATAVEVTVDSLGRRSVKQLVTPLCELTPYRGFQLDGGAIVQSISKWLFTHQLANPEFGSVLFTGEAQRAANVLAVAETLTRKWSGVSAAHLDPRMESIVAAHGAGAVDLSASRPGQEILHMDIGGGTTNLAWIENGKIVDTACLDIGARKWVFDPKTLEIEKRTKTAIDFEKKNPQWFRDGKLSDVAAIAERLASDILNPLFPDYWVIPWEKKKNRYPNVVVFSGGVSDCFEDTTHDVFRFGDLGPSLAHALEERLSTLGLEFHAAHGAGKATALGISAFSFQLSGASTFASASLSYANIPVLNGKDVESLALPQHKIAIWVPELDDVAKQAKEWGQLLQSPRFHSIQEVVFFTRENVGKAFGYSLQQLLPKGFKKIAVLDEIEDSVFCDLNMTSVVDVRPAETEGRYLIAIKTLRLF